MRFLEKLNTPVAAVVVLVLVLAVNGLLFYHYWLVSGGQEDRYGLASSGQEEQGAVLVGAGNIADCSGGAGSTGYEDTADLLDGIAGTVFVVGDNAYPNRTYAEFENCYGPSWGRHKARTYPSPGNVEYHDTASASGYFDYFGAAAGDPTKGYYSYDLGEWHVVVLNSECGNVGGCEDDSPMLRWLKEDLAANPQPCTLAYWHHPLFSSGYEGDQDWMKPTWEALYAANADVVVNGHDPIYERFGPQDPNGVADSERGIREFVVGTGGVQLFHPLGKIKPNSKVLNYHTYGVLKLSLRSTGYDWEFVPVEGETFTDSGSARCH